MDLSTLTVDEAADFVSEKLGLPAMGDMFREQDVDGSVLLLLETSTIRQFLPLVTLGQCVKLFSNLKKYQEEQISPQVPQPSLPEPLLFTPPRHEDQLHGSPRSPSPPPAMPSPDRSLDSRTPMPIADTPERSSPRAASPGLNMNLNMTPKKPMPKEFPIGRVRFTPDGDRMIQTGKVTAGGKTSITDAVCAEMLTYSVSDGYVERAIKENAATALVSVYPTLTMGMNIVNAKKAWRKSFTQKLVNWRKRNKLQDPKMAVMKEKYTHPKALAAVQTNTLRKRKVTNKVDLMEDEINEQETRKQSIQREMMKQAKSRNMRLIQAETEETYPLRRRCILEDAPHVKDFIRDWPSLRVEPIMLKEFTLVCPEVEVFDAFDSRLNALLSQLVDEARRKAMTYPKSHPLMKILSIIPWVENTSPEFDTDLNIIAAMAGLAYILPTTSKKEGESQQYLIDICASDTTKEEVCTAVRDRHQPFVMVYGNLTDITKILVYVDKEPVIVCSSISKALYIMLAYYFVLNVEYARPASSALEFIQLACLGLPVCRPQTRVRELMRKMGL